MKASRHDPAAVRKRVRVSRRECRIHHRLLMLRSGLQKEISLSVRTSRFTRESESFMPHLLRHRGRNWGRVAVVSGKSGVANTGIRSLHPLDTLNALHSGERVTSATTETCSGTSCLIAQRRVIVTSSWLHVSEGGQTQNYMHTLCTPNTRRLTNV